MRAQRALRWIALTLALAIFAASGFAAARLFADERAAARPSVTVTPGAETTPTATPTPQDNGTVKPPPPPPPPPPPVTPDLYPVSIHLARPDGSYGSYGCGYFTVPYTYHVQGDLVRAQVEFLRSAVGSGGDINLLYSVPLTIDYVFGDGAYLELHLSGDIPYVDGCTDLGVQAQLVNTFTSPYGNTVLYINGQNIYDFFYSRALEHGDDSFPPYDPGPHVPSVISGVLGYPSHEVPALEIRAVNQQDPANSAVIYTEHGQTTFRISDLYGGDYIIEARVLGGDDSFVGRYSHASLCGLDVTCTDHSPVVVSVPPGETYDGVLLNDWYAGAGIQSAPEAETTPEAGG